MSHDARDARTYFFTIDAITRPMTPNMTHHDANFCMTSLTRGYCFQRSPARHASQRASHSTSYRVAFTCIEPWYIFYEFLQVQKVQKLYIYNLLLYDKIQYNPLTTALHLSSVDSKDKDQHHQQLSMVLIFY